MRSGLALLFLSAAAWAQNPPAPPNPAGGFQVHPGVDQKKVDEAIRKGVAFLKTSDSPKSHVGEHSDELKLLTYIHAGLPEGEYADLLKKCMDARLEKTYKVCLLAMCLEEVDRVKYQYWIQRCGQFLVDNIRADGGFTYGEPSVYVEDVPTTAPRKDVATTLRPLKPGEALPPPGSKPKVLKTLNVKKQKDGPAQRSDNSNSQYGALGMRACHDAGIIFPKEWVEKARNYWVTNQHQAEGGAGAKPKDPAGPAVASGGPALGVPRGWCYDDGDGAACGHGGKPYGSMSVGAIGAVCIYDFMLKKEWKKDKVVLDGLAWLDANWAITENKGPSETAKGATNAWLYYYLYAIERAGMLYDTSVIGAHDWYLEGAKYLLEAQKADGSWDASHFKHPTWDTCFAILFLKRATRRLDVATTAVRPPPPVPNPAPEKK
jgi:hypothetical protein